jgi:hypothetical protein
MNNKPNTYHKDLAHLPPALQPLTGHARWVVWRWEQRTTKDGSAKWTKPPYQTQYPSQHAKSDDPDTWGSHQDAVAAWTAGHADGIGYMLWGASIGAIDLDRCVDPNSAKLDLWVEQLLAEANGAYKETTVSGCGLRVLGTIDRAGPEVHRKFTFNRATGAGLEIYRNTKRYITVSALELGLCAGLPPLDSFIDALLARHTGETRQQTNGLDFNDAGKQDGGTDYDSLIHNGAPEGERSEAFNAVVWHLASKGMDVDTITDELAKHPNGIAAKYADRLYEEVARCYGKWLTAKRQAATGKAAGDATEKPWPTIQVIAGELPRIVNEAELALIDLDDEIYQRGLQVIRPVMQRHIKSDDGSETQRWRLMDVNQPYLRFTLGRAARFMKYDGRSDIWKPIDPPHDVAQLYLANAGRWKLPVLTGIAGTPFLRQDGSLCDAPGYDSVTGLIYKPVQEFPPIPPQPTKEDAQAALSTLEDLVSTFPFTTPADKSVALAAMLTALDRHNVGAAPLFGLTAPAAGTGKTKLVNIVSVVATGYPAVPINQANEEEFEKRLNAEVVAGNRIISIDNCNDPLDSSFMCTQLTEETVGVRILGKTEKVETPMVATVFANGNNLVIVGDLTRRSLLCTMDARCERPELRKFDQDAVDVAKANRGHLVVAVLTVLRAWHLSDKKIVTLPSFGSFERWSHRIRSALVWLGHPDPCETVLKVRAEDPKAADLTAVIAQWEEHIGLNTELKLQQIVDRASLAPDLYVALMSIASARAKIIISPERLGRWLSKNRNRIVGNRVFRRRKLDGYSLWRLMDDRAHDECTCD